ncbi:hypothetical protein D9758_008437 [Tetrapyrgos nigripes]|uniref:NADP-dependent oxidoreductase domain-containing protein n=1 Tax=Tetrapyrgos nigripes TaxID=182062 RepID=A0A8H5CRF2_9AGAR|nr:hypothetical protein D9758_008437 [Tetrapyrgos nigripes]
MKVNCNMQTAKFPHFPLNNGTSIPAVGLGCWMGNPGEDSRVYDMVLKAIKNGYRHFDTASCELCQIDNEKQVCQAIRDSGVPRDDIFLTTKLLSDKHDQVLEAFEESLSSLDCGYIDLYLMDWPMAYAPGQQGLWSQEALSVDVWPTFNDAWREMEKLVETGEPRKIHWCIQLFHPEPRNFLPENDLRRYCESKGIQMVAWSPLGQPCPDQPISLLPHPTTKSIASALHVSVGQILLSWSIQRGVVVIPKTENEVRMRDNISLLPLPERFLKEIDGIHKEEGMHRSLSYVHMMSDDREGKVFGWSYKQLGWNMKKGGVVKAGGSQIVLPRKSAQGQEYTS